MHIIPKEILVNIATQQNCQQKYNAQQWSNQSSSSSNDSKRKLVNLMYSSKAIENRKKKKRRYWNSKAVWKAVE